MAAVVVVAVAWEAKTKAKTTTVKANNKSWNSVRVGLYWAGATAAGAAAAAGAAMAAVVWGGRQRRGRNRKQRRRAE